MIIRDKAKAGNRQGFVLTESGLGSPPRTFLICHHQPIASGSAIAFQPAAEYALPATIRTFA